MKAMILFVLLGVSAAISTGKAQTHETTEEITLKADAFGVFRYKLSNTGEVAVKLNNKSSDNIKSIICFGNLCYRSNETDCLTKKDHEVLEIAWYDIQEKHAATLELISCTDNTVKTIYIQLIP